MPYRRVGKTIEHFKSGRWSVKQVCANAEEAKKALRLLNGIENSPEFAAKVHSGKGGKK